MDQLEAACPCSSGLSYTECCKRFHEGEWPENALQLMRSRYTAYQLNKPDYIIKTTHPGSPQYSNNLLSWKRSISNFSRNTQFNRLEVLEFKEHNTLAVVTFTIYITQKGKDATFTEKSYFEKLKGQWLYRGGQIAEGHAPNLVTTGQFRLLPLAYYGEAILRRKADPIVEINDDIKKLVDEMVETMDASDGLGLAAPQVHHSIRLFVIRMPVETEEGQLDLGEVRVFINPVLSAPSSETWKASEGCLSIPAIHSDVERPREITVEYTNLEGKRKKERFSDWPARVIMHENDHINGILFIDRLEKEEKAQLKSFLRQLEERIHGKKL
jgi:peptide deformylase